MPKKTSKKMGAAKSKVSIDSSPLLPSSAFPSFPTFPRFSADMLERFVPALIIVCVALSFVVGMLWQKVNYLEGGKAATAGTQAQAVAQTPAPTVSLDTIKGLFKENLIKFGDENRKVLFVEIADPSCPYCHIASGLNSDLNNQQPQFKLVKDGGSYLAPVPEMKKLVDSGQASFIYIYYPGHGNGEMATKAMYCANEQGKFWQVHDLLMTSKGYDLVNNTFKNDKTKSGELADYLASAIDKNFLKGCLDSGKYDARLADDMVVAKGLNIQGTPGFYVNNSSFPGAYSYVDMEPVVKSALGI